MRAFSFPCDNEITIATMKITTPAHHNLVYKKQWCSVLCLAVLRALVETMKVHSSEMDLSHL